MPVTDCLTLYYEYLQQLAVGLECYGYSAGCIQAKLQAESASIATALASGVFPV